MTLIKKPQKQWYYHQAKFINMNFLQVKKYPLLIKVNFIYSSLGEAFKKLVKATEDQRKQNK